MSTINDFNCWTDFMVSSSIEEFFNEMSFKFWDLSDSINKELEIGRHDLEFLAKKVYFLLCWSGSLND